MSLSVILSIIAIAISLYIGFRQIAQFRRVNHFPVVANLLADFRNADFHVKYNYVVTKLRSEHPTVLGIMNLPEGARSDVIDIAFYFQTFASLRRFKILRESKNLGNLYRRTIDVWDAIEPYVLQERVMSQGQANEDMLAILQEYAGRLKKKVGDGGKLPGLAASPPSTKSRAE